MVSALAGGVAGVLSWVVCIPFDVVKSRVQSGDVSSATSGAARTFDITVHLKEGNPDVQFVNLQRSDYKEFLRFLQAKKVRIKNFAGAGYGETSATQRSTAGARVEDDDKAAMREQRPLWSSCAT